MISRPPVFALAVYNQTHEPSIGDARRTTSEQGTGMSKKLVVCCDGTWNDPRDKTHIWTIAHGLADRDADGNEQRAFYQEGVGTAVGELVRGGAFGVGLSENVREAYHWLVDQYEPGDEIFCFGFSRGAYTARSLGGFLARVGLIGPSDEPPETEARVAAMYLAYRGGTEPGEAPRHRPNIRFMGVFDTVGSLGVPITWVKRVGKWLGVDLGFHDTRLSPRVECACQALAIDERREPFAPTLWTSAPVEIEGRPGVTQEVHQVWFPGVHSDIGGGYPEAEKDLSRIPLNWMLTHAERCGLVFRDDIADRLIDDEPFAELHDSMSSAWDKIHDFSPSLNPYVRPIGNDARARSPRPDGGPEPTDVAVEAIHRSAFDRRAATPGRLPPDQYPYAPANLEGFSAPAGDVLVVHSPA